MAEAKLTISYRFDFTGMIEQLRKAADILEALQAEAPLTLADDGANASLVDINRQGPDLH